MTQQFELSGRRILVTGHRGMVGSALVRRLEREGCTILTAGRADTDLRRQSETESLLDRMRPDAVIVAAATVGGILDNAQRPAEFLYDNLMIAANLIEASRRVAVRKLVFLGSTCIFPRDAPQPIPESALLTGPLEPTNEWYAIAKIAGLKLCDAYRRQWGCDFIAAQPTNLYGPNDSFDLERSHVLPALMRKIHEAKQGGAEIVTLWGSGTPLREFLHADDLADALVFLLERFSGEGFFNIGSGDEVSILELASAIADVVGWRGRFVFDTSRPDGTPRKRVDSTRLDALGWKRRIALRDGLATTYAWFLQHALDGQGRVLDRNKVAA